MCTAITFQQKNFYFGRNLDFEYSYHESVTITPRNFTLSFRCAGSITTHYAIIGMAMVDSDYPLYFDGTNEKGLCMAALYFPGNARYQPVNNTMDNIAPFELIPWILGQCADITQAEKALETMNLADIAYSPQYPLSPLHWIIADKHRAITVEPMADGIHIFENPVGVLTNNPPFDFHMYNLANYLNLTSKEPENRFAPGFDLSPYSRGMGAIGLPGDFSSTSRFVRGTFVKFNSVCENKETSCVSQFFHILASVSQPRGCAAVGDGYEKTIYASCCNADTGTYYYTTYDNPQITGISLQNTDLDSQTLLQFPLKTDMQIYMEN